VIGVLWPYRDDVALGLFAQHYLAAEAAEIGVGSARPTTVEAVLVYVERRSPGFAGWAHSWGRLSLASSYEPVGGFGSGP
jgi:hypothetical protein